MKKTASNVQRVSAIAATLFIAACGITSADSPQTARVVIEATAAEALELVVSTDFEVVLDQLTGNQDPRFASSDTVAITSDYEARYTFPNDARIFVRLANDTDAVVPVKIQVFLDGSVEYDVTAQLGNGGFLEYLYRFNQPTLNP